jgi:hypothetical protein
VKRAEFRIFDRLDFFHFVREFRRVHQPFVASENPLESPDRLGVAVGKTSALKSVMIWDKSRPVGTFSNRRPAGTKGARGFPRVFGYCSQAFVDATQTDYGRVVAQQERGQRGP